MKRLISLLTGFSLLIVLFPMVCMAQSSTMKKANSYYDNLSYINAIAEYKKVLSSDSTNEDAIIRLAHCYRLVNNTVEAEKWYEKVVNLSQAKPAHILYYIQALMSNGNYTVAQHWVDQYMLARGNDERVKKIIESLTQINSFYDDSANFTVNKLKINSDNSDFCPVFYGDGIVFSSARGRAEFISRTDEWTGQPFVTLFYSKGKESALSNPEVFSSSITTKYNNGPVCFNKEGNQLYITRNNIDNGHTRSSDSGIVKLQIFSLKKVGAIWMNETPFQYNNDNYNCAHPWLSPDGNRLFFSSDMPGGYGSMDLYVCHKEGNSWGKPVNLGSSINTAESDAFPFIDSRGGLFFASKGHSGLGGYDVYYSSRMLDDYSPPVNVGYPINSSGDDFGWIQNDQFTSGYFTSNRGGKSENDDIYYFKRTSVILNVKLYDSKTKMPISASSVKVFEAGMQQAIEMTSENGVVSLFLTPGKNYHIIAVKDKYMIDTINFATNDYDLGEVVDMDFLIEKEYVENYLAGKVSDNENRPIIGAEVRIINKESGEEYVTASDEYGNYQFDLLPMDSRFTIEARKDKCVSLPVEHSTFDVTRNETAIANLTLNCVVDIVKLENIYYDFNEYAIREDAKPELDKVVTMLQLNPEMSIELRSHTDCIGTDKSNMKLSQRRAKSAVIYLTEKGIASSRLVARGFGESKPLIACDCEGIELAACSDADRQNNRRTEFKILNLDPGFEISHHNKK